jgi:hypothetical protein
MQRQNAPRWLTVELAECKLPEHCIDCQDHQDSATCTSRRWLDPFL